MYRHYNQQSCNSFIIQMVLLHLESSTIHPIRVIRAQVLTIQICFNINISLLNFSVSTVFNWEQILLWLFITTSQYVPWIYLTQRYSQGGEPACNYIFGPNVHKNWTYDLREGQDWIIAPFRPLSSQGR